MRPDEYAPADDREPTDDDRELDGLDALVPLDHEWALDALDVFYERDEREALEDLEALEELTWLDDDPLDDEDR